MTQAGSVRQILLVVDVQSTFSPPAWLVQGVNELSARMPSLATLELHDETRVPFMGQLGWHPAEHDSCLVQVDRVFVKNGYVLSPQALAHIQQARPERVLVCGVQTETCVLAAGFALFDAGLYPTLITDLTVGSSLDRSGKLGIDLWRHHFGRTLTSAQVLCEL